MEQITNWNKFQKLEQISKIGTNFEIGINFKNGTNFEIGFFFENGTTFKLKQFKKWSKLRIGTNFKFEISNLIKFQKSEHIKI
jgi:hypothetical protein